LEVGVSLQERDSRKLEQPNEHKDYEEVEEAIGFSETLLICERNFHPRLRRLHTH